MRIAPLIGCCVLAAAFSTWADAASKSAEGLSELAVSMDASSPEREAAARALAEAMADIAGEPGKKPTFFVTKSGKGVFWGDLFGTGHCFALMEVSDVGSGDAGVAYAEWVNGVWSLRQAWKIGTVWRPKGWKESGGDYLPATPSVEPFSREDFSGDGVPEIVIAGGVGKYFQEHYLLRFSPKTKELDLVAYAMDRPEKVEDYVRLYFDSGRRSIWSEWEFGRWKGAELETVASWHSETGYNENDPTFSEGMRRGADGKPVMIRVLYGHGQEIEGDRYQLSRNSESSGTMRVAWKNPEHLPENADEMEGAWLFEKITGLPRRLYPAREGTAPLGRFEDFATVTVEGNAEMAEIFQTKR